jgi:hypothetical protein
MPAMLLNSIYAAILLRTTVHGAHLIMRWEFADSGFGEVLLSLPQNQQMAYCSVEM